ncbi:hypothetical protein DMO17_10965 [Aquipseudomonas alcaligenes]|uniref:DUF1353 domain-containing protein n=1 Tax=Aquipseudomonas alcaligenes TaxID=43263 RepID=A0A2V4L4Y2_AQUAC|nr:DUF1353 domain-containing protein [Pseudomonas alcaligenes]PYC24582.1 hypothetical protein DMO17_10965 [Pseudomonas alcaligenes]
MQSPFHRHLLIHFGNLLVTAIGLALLGLAAWLQPSLVAPLLWAGVPVYLGVLLPRWAGRAERRRRAAAARAASEAKWGFACRDHAGPWLNYIDQPFVRHCPEFAGRYFYGEWLLLHDGWLVVNPGHSSVDLQRQEVRYDFSRSSTYAWDGCTPKVPFYWLAIIGIPDWWEKPHPVLRLCDGQLCAGEVFWPLAHPASLVHDALYQYLNAAPVAKHEADLLFLRMLREAGMAWPLAFAYYLAVRLFGAPDVRGPRPGNSALRCTSPLPGLEAPAALNFAAAARSV